jgi:hypothetical protein
MFMRKKHFALIGATASSLLLITKGQKEENSGRRPKIAARTHDVTEEQRLRYETEAGSNLHHVENNLFSVLAIGAHFVVTSILLEVFDLVGT